MPYILVSLKIVSVADVYMQQIKNGRVIKNYKFRKMQEEADMVYFKVLSHICLNELKKTVKVSQ
jgi:hypothetical protein